jgi:DmsE family decaheme c-type cytochrome
MKKAGWMVLAVMALVLFAGGFLTWNARAEEKGGMVGKDTCATCHEDVSKAFEATPHAQSALGCEGCHGPGQAHVDGGGDKTKIAKISALPPAEQSDACLKCHAKGQQAHWSGSTHDSRKVSCISCHETHPKGAVPKSLLSKPQTELCVSCHPKRRAQLYRSGHMPMREGKMECSSCHNPHGTVSEGMLVQNSINENCYACHAEKRGPFVWEHAPVREDCTTCHDAHGSVNSYMLKVKQPILCQPCHIANRHPSTPHFAKDQYSWNHGCLNCHPMIHGSNHPSGARFLR